MIWQLSQVCLLIMSMAYWWWHKLDRTEKNVAVLALLLKYISAAGIIYYYIVLAHPGDLGFYVSQARYLVSQSESVVYDIWTLSLPLDEWQQRTAVFIRIFSSIYWLSGCSIWLVGAYFTLISFMALWLLVQQIKLLNPALAFPAYFGFFFIPTVVFWTSGSTKDSLVLMLVALIAAGCIRFFLNRNRLLIVVMLLLIAGLAIIRFYVAGAVLLALGFGWSYHRWKDSAKKMAITVVVFIVVAFGLMTFLQPRMRFSRLPLTVYELNQEIAMKGNPENLIKGLDVAPTYLSLISHLPIGFLTCFYRPVPFEWNFKWSLLPALESVLAIILTILTLFHHKKIKWNELGIMVIIFIVILGPFVTLTTPNFGSLLRYRSIFTAFFFFLISIIPLQLYFQSKIKKP